MLCVCCLEVRKNGKCAEKGHELLPGPCQALAAMDMFEGVFSVKLDRSGAVAMVHQANTTLYTRWLMKALLAPEKADQRKVVGKILAGVSEKGLRSGDFPPLLWEKVQSATKFRPARG